MELTDIGNGYVFARIAQPTHDAWGDLRVTGTMFDTIDGTVQTGIWFSGPEWMSADEIIRNASREAMAS